MTTLTGRGLGTFSGTARGYTPAEPSKWNPVPDRVAEALDIVAGGGGAIALANAFVWQPGGPTSAPGLYNSTSFGPVAAAMSVVPGPKTLGIDTTYGVATIAGGPYELSDVTFEPCLLTSFALVTFAVGAEISADTTNLTLRRTEFEVLGTSGAVWTPSEAGAQMTLDTSFIICTAGGVFLDVADSTVFTLTLENSGTIATSMGGVAVAKVEASGVLDVLAVTNAIIDTNVFAQGVASGGEVNVQADGSAFIDTTQGAGPVYTYLVRDPTPTAIFAPGATGTLNGNVFTDPELLRQWLNLAPGAPRVVVINDTDAAAHFTAGSWNLDNVTLLGQVSSPTGMLIIDEGAIITSSCLAVENSLFVSNRATATVPWTPESFSSLRIGPGANISSTGAVEFLHVEAAASFTQVYLTFGCSIGDAVHPVITVDAGQTVVVDVGIAAIFAHALAGAGTALLNLDATAVIHTPQDITTLTTQLQGQATQVGYAPATAGNWQPAPTLVNTALDQLAAPNFVQSNATVGSGTNTTTAVTGNIAKKRSGKVRVSGTATGISTSATTTVTVSLLRDATPIFTWPAITVVSTAGFAIPVSFIDPLPDTANHTYTVQAVAAAGNITSGVTGNYVQAIEL